MIEVEHLTKRYGGLTAVDDLSFQIRPNSVVGLLGHNGAGKSTTMRMLTGYLSPSAGRVRIYGCDLQDEPLKARAHIGYLPELPPLYADLTVAEHLRVVCDLRRIDAARRGAEVDRVCEALGLAGVRGRRIRNLSKGYRQRVGFAAALVGEPDFLILDEPTVGLDPSQVIEIRALIARLSAHASVLISSHILSEISSVCDSLLILRRGQLAAQGTQEEICRAHQSSGAVLLRARGSEEAVRAALREAVPDAVCDITREGGALACAVHAAASDELHGRLFHAFARRSDALTLLTLKTAERSLEDIFLEIMQS